jgi:AraC-like DNA-binding protein
LTRSFRRTFGCSIGSYIRRRRLEEAARMLRQTGTSISAIAIHHGFADQAHFTRALRRAAGRTPGALRSAKTD